jgi:hypothetical protein
LTNVTVTGDDLGGATLTSATLTGVDLSTTNLEGGTKSGGIDGAPVALPQHWEFVNGYLVGPEANLSNASLAGLNLANADLLYADLVGADLTSVNLDGANLTWANLAGATVTGATFTGATWYYTNCPDGTNSNKYIAGCFSPVDTTPPTVTVTGAVNGHVYVGLPITGCKTTDDGTVATPAAILSTRITTGGNDAVGLFRTTCFGAVDLAGNQQQSPVIVTYTAVWGMKGFIAPANGSTVARSSKTITVRFRLTLYTGASVFGGTQASLAAAHGVRATLSGPGIKAVTVNCGWNASQANLTCAIPIPSGVRTGSSQRYTITAAENVGTGFLTIPAVLGTVNPEVIHFR